MGGTIKGRVVETIGTWNYALNLSAPMTFEGGGAVPILPFSDTEPSPVRIRASGRRVDEWKAGVGHGPLVPPASPVSTENPVETLELVPFGSTNVRFAVFPTLGESTYV